MKDIFERRTRNLAILKNIAENVFQQKKGSSKQYTDHMFSEYIGLSKSYLSQVWSKTRNLSERSARLIESNVNLPPGWLDKDHDTQDYQDVFLDGSLVKKLILLYDEFIHLDVFDVSDKENSKKKIIGMIEDVILKTSKYQDISLEDLINLYIKN